MKLAGVLVCLFAALFCSIAVHAQEISPQKRQEGTLLLAEDSVTIVPPDSISVASKNGSRVERQSDPIQVTVDSILIATTSDAFFAPSSIFKPTPRKAVIYSVLFPGMGQVYNRKYWKLPILYGGFVGLTYAITWNNGYYRDYLGGYQDIMDDNPDTNRWHEMLPYGVDPEDVDTDYVKRLTELLQTRKDYYRYYRDLSIICTVGLYMVAMVDAYVDAQLFDFDMSPDLSMRMEPAIIREERSNHMGRSSYGIQFSFHF